VGPSWVGDTVLAQPFMMRLHERHPGVVVDVLAPPSTAALLRRMSEVTDVIENPFRHGELKVFARRRLGLDLKARRYDAAFVLPNSLKSALPPFFAAIPVRTGYRGEMRLGLLNDVRMLDEKRLPLMVERFAALADPPRTALVRPLPRPRLRVDARARARAVERLGLAGAAAVAAFCPGAEYGPAKRWPAAHFAQLADALHAQGWRVWIFGAQGDREIGDEIVRLSAGGPIENLCGVTRLDEAIDLLSAARVVVTNDSGLMHVAAALDLPTVALYGSSSPGFTPPLSPAARVVNLGLPCSPCFERTCPLGHLRCLQDLSPGRVGQEIAAALGTAPPGAVFQA
jgi:heptosyltransferase-2